MKLTGPDRFVVSVNGVDLEGEHNIEREAIERAWNIEHADPSAAVEYRNVGKIRVEANVAAPTPPSPAPVHYDFQSDFTRNWTDSGFMEQAKELGKRASLVTVDGKACVRLHTEPGDSGVNGSLERLRNDLTTSQQTTDGYAGRHHIWEHSFLLPSDFVQPPQTPRDSQPWHGGLVFDFHNTADKGGQANFQIAIYPATALFPDWPTGIRLELHAGNPAAPTKLLVPVQKGAITKNEWYHCKHEVLWTPDSTGFFKSWVNGVQYMDHKGPTLYVGEGVYVKLACYGTVPWSVIHTGVKRVAIAGAAQ